MTDQPKDFAVKITVKNNRILQAMKKAGIQTLKELSKRAMIEQSYLGTLVSFKRSPLRNGEWTEHAYNVSSALHCEPEELWPSHIKHLRSNKTSVELTMNADELRNISAPANLQIDVAALKQLISRLPEKEQRVLNEVVMNGKTHREAGKGLAANGGDVSDTRTQHILAKAVGRIHHPSRLKFRKFDDFIEN